MSYRTYCDCCERQTDRCVVGERVRGNYVHRNKAVNYEIMLGIGPGNMNGGNLCIDCLEDVLCAALGIERASREVSRSCCPHGIDLSETDCGVCSQRT